MTFLVGTSGWQYADWRGRMYPAGVPQRRWLEHHAEHWQTVEVNNAFYRLPTREVFAGWAARTPPDYVVTVKASRFLTHIKRLREPQEPVARLLDRAAGLGTKLGAVLLQLPPDLPCDLSRLAECLAAFPSGVPVAVEPRHASWWNPDLRDLLTTHGAALCWADRDSRPVTPLWRTADWGYLRLHAGGGPDRWPYPPEVLQRWADLLADTWSPAERVFVYTNNDPGGAALVDGVQLARYLRARGRRTGRVPTVAELGAAAGPAPAPAPGIPADGQPTRTV